MMINGQIFLKKLMLMGIGVGLMTILVTTAKADERVVRSHIFDLSAIEEVELSNAVGSIDITPVDGTEMRVIVDIESDEGGFFRRQVEVDDLDIKTRERGDTLFLSFKERKTHANWTIEMPDVKRTIIEMGVGELDLEIGTTDLDIEMGVGDVRIDAPLASVGRINLNVGVGDARIRGGEILHSESAFISKSIRAEGEGKHDLEIDLGVGDLNLRLD